MAKSFKQFSNDASESALSDFKAAVKKHPNVILADVGETFGGFVHLDSLSTLNLIKKLDMVSALVFPGEEGIYYTEFEQFVRFWGADYIDEVLKIFNRACKKSPLTAAEIKKLLDAAQKTSNRRDIERIDIAFWKLLEKHGAEDSYGGKIN